MAGRNHSMTRMRMGKKGGGKHKAKRITFERADNGGYSSRTEFEQPPMDPDKPQMVYNPVKDHTGVHASMEDAQNHMASMFGEGGDQEPDGDEGAGEPDEEAG